jgi:ketosteroid isomerase-like protein
VTASSSATMNRSAHDRRAIERVLYDYATALDTKDWALLEPDTVFTPDGFEPLEGVDAIRDAVSSALEGQRSQHYLTNVQIELDGDRASSTCSLQAQHIRVGTPGGDTLIVAGVYRDELVARAGTWRFVRRSLQVLWTRGNPAVPLGKVAG